jgi:hypothetical protein
MKKLLVIIILVCMVVIPVLYASVGGKMDALNTSHEQTAKAIQARALLQGARAYLRQVNLQVKEIADSGTFETLDPSIKQALNSAWIITKQAEAALDANEEVTELLDWRK